VVHAESFELLLLLLQPAIKNKKPIDKIKDVKKVDL
jgi:hypothetical protein